MNLKIKIWALCALITSSAYAVQEFELAGLGLSAGHGSNAADLDVSVTNDQIINRTFSPNTVSQMGDKINTRSAYSFETFTIQGGGFSGQDISGQSQNVKAFAEKAIGKDLVAGGFLNYNAITSDFFMEGFASNFALGAYGKYYLPVGVEQNLNVGLGYNLLKYDEANDLLLGGTLGHDISLTASIMQVVNQTTFHTGLMYDYFFIGDVMNQKVSLATQGIHTISDQLSLGANIIYTKIIDFEYDSGFFKTDESNLINTDITTIGLIGNYTLSESMLLNVTLEKTLSLDRHSNLVIGIGTEFGF